MLYSTKSILVTVNLIMLVGFEGLTRCLTYYGVIPYHHYPTSEERVLADMNRHYGVWRHPNRSVRHSGACFDVAYRTNSHGMRDAERSFKSESEERVVVLGDSFVEGYGVEAEDRLTEAAERSSGVEFLNFGVSGDFSSTQQYLLYRELVSRFEHSAVALFFLPDNDFEDNDPENFESDRYRPYLKRTESTEDTAQREYEVYYPVAFEERDREQGMSIFRQTRRHLYNNIHLFNAIRQLGDQFERSSLKNEIKDSYRALSESAFDHFEEQDLRKLLWGYEKIAELAHPRPLHIFLTPREIDFIQSDEIHGAPKVLLRLKDFADDHSNVFVTDLLAYFERELERRDGELDDAFLSCDGHWSPKGHAIAGKALREVVLGEQVKRASG